MIDKEDIALNFQFEMIATTLDKGEYLKAFSHLKNIICDEKGLTSPQRGKALYYMFRLIDEKRIALNSISAQEKNELIATLGNIRGNPLQPSLDDDPRILIETAHKNLGCKENVVEDTYRRAYFLTPRMH